ncbi:MAG: hypothetical protein ACK46H_04305, partial [Bacteroidota bacterium]
MQSGIRQKLNEFIHTHYRQRLIRGAMTAGALGLVVFGSGFLLEHYLWLGSVDRAVLFWAMWVLFLPLVAFGVMKPLLHMQGVGKTLSQQEAAKWIGNYFPEVSDKLMNLLQLEDMAGVQKGNELLLASIEEKTLVLQKVPFVQALDWQKHKKWVYRLGALLLLLVGMGVYESAELLQGASRVFQYQKEFVRQAPFSVRLVNDNLVVNEGQDLKLQWQTEGAVIPESMEVKIGQQWRRARRIKPGVFVFELQDLMEDQTLVVRSMDFVVAEHTITVKKQPHWQAVEVFADFPDYTGIEDGVLSQSTVLEVVEGTRLEYRLKGERVNAWRVGSSFQKIQQGSSQRLVNAERGSTYIHRAMRDARLVFAMEGPQGLSADTLQSALTVRADAFPDIQLETIADTVRLGTWYFAGIASDDYLVNEVTFLYRVVGKNALWKRVVLFEGGVSQYTITHAVDLVN